MKQEYSSTSAVRVYARVQGNRVIEYPVTSATIEQRGHSFAQYHVVVEEPITLSNEAGMFIDTSMVIENQTVRIKHTYLEKTLEELIFFFRKAFENGAWVPFNYADIPAGEIKAFQKKLGQAATDALNTVVKERYDSLDALLSRYSNSSNPVWKKEAAFMQAALDGLWTNLLKYFQELASEQRPLPISLEDITYLVKAPSWSDMA